MCHCQPIHILRGDNWWVFSSSRLIVLHPWIVIGSFSIMVIMPFGNGHLHIRNQGVIYMSINENTGPKYYLKMYLQGWLHWSRSPCFWHYSTRRRCDLTMKHHDIKYVMSRMQVKLGTSNIYVDSSSKISHPRSHYIKYCYSLWMHKRLGLSVRR